MDEKKILDMEDLMIDYGEMTSFDFNSLSFKEIQDLQNITGSDYSKQAIPFKYGKFDLVDLFHSFISQKEQ